jgi:tetratricopeptide (TPR) repeat protein
MLEALMDRRQGNFEKAIQEFNKAMTRDPRNSTPIAALADTLVSTRQFYASEQAYDRAIRVSPDQSLLRVKKAYDVTSKKTGDNTDVCSAIASLPASIADDRSVSLFRLFLALSDRDWLQAKELLEKINGGEDDGEFAYGQIPVPVDCYAILITRLQEEQFEGNSKFVEVRQELSKRAERSPAKANLVSQLAVVDALLNNKVKAISEAKRAVEMLPVSRDAMDGPGMLINLAVVYAWTDEPDLAFATLAPLINIPSGIYYGQLSRDPYWEPLRKDPRYEKLLAELAPKD